MIVIVCAIPLGAFTAHVVVDELKGDAPSEDPAEESLNRLLKKPDVTPDDARLVAEKITKDVVIDRKVLDALGDFQPIGRKEPGVIDALPPEARLAKMTEELSTIGAARKAFRGYTDIYRTSEDELQSLRNYQETHDLEKLQDDRVLSSLVTKRIDELERAKLRSKLLANAEQQFDDKDYDACLKTIEEIPLDGADDETVEQITNLEGSAKFRIHWQNYRQRPNDPAGNLKQLQNLLAELVPAISADDRSALESFQAKEREFVCMVAVEKFNQLEQTDVAKYSVAAAGMLRGYKEYPEYIAPIRQKFTSWLKAHLIDRKLPKYDRRTMESTLGSGKLIRGVFEIGGGANSTRKWYRYWATVADADKDRNKWAMKYADELKVLPDRPLDWRIVSKHNNLVAQLRGKLDSQRHWQEYAEACRSLATELDGYKPGNGNENPAAFIFGKGRQADEVLQAWDNVRFVLTGASGGEE